MNGTRWEVEGHGGFSRAVSPSGSSALPGPGAPLTTSNPIFPSWETPSWFFGDGAATLNSASAQFGLSNRITPLDSALNSPGLNSASAAAVGFRVRRIMTPRFSAEFSVDFLTGSGNLSDELVAAVEASRDTFESAFTALLSTGPILGAVVDSTSATVAGSSLEVAITGGIEMRFQTPGSFVPYATFGAGVMTGLGDLPSVTLEGNYRFSILGEVPINETDRVTLRHERGKTFVGVLGGGVRRDVASRWGFRIDGRLFLGRPGARLLLDANPSVTIGRPADSIEMGTYPNIQFSNDPATGRRSTLGGPPLEGFAAFTGKGLQTRVLLTVGVFTRF